MSTRGRTTAAAPLSYEDFDPSFEWVREEEAFDILLISLPGFKSHQLKLQLDKDNLNLKTSGERALDTKRRSRFSKEFPLPENYDVDNIRAKFENETLQVRFPKLIAEEDVTVQIPTTQEAAAAEPHPDSAEQDKMQKANGKSRESVGAREEPEKEKERVKFPAKEEAAGEGTQKANGKSTASSVDAREEPEKEKKFPAKEEAAGEGTQKANGKSTASSVDAREEPEKEKKFPAKEEAAGEGTQKANGKSTASSVDAREEPEKEKKFPAKEEAAGEGTQKANGKSTASSVDAREEPEKEKANGKFQAQEEMVAGKGTQKTNGKSTDSVDARKEKKEEKFQDKEEVAGKEMVEDDTSNGEKKIVPAASLKHADSGDGGNGKGILMDLTETGRTLLLNAAVASLVLLALGLYAKYKS